jgi:hypothetical protein
MASIWKIGSVDVYVTGHNESGDIKLAKITPLDSTGSSVLHYFGSGGQEVSVDGWLFSEANKSSLRTYRDNGTTITLTSDQGSEGSYKIQSIEFKKYGPYVKLSLTGYSTTATIYKFQAKLVEA